MSIIDSLPDNTPHDVLRAIDLLEKHGFVVTKAAPSQTTGWRSIQEAPDVVRKYGHRYTPGIGGFLYQLMMTDDGPVILKFAQPSGGGVPPLEYWLLVQKAPE